MLGHSVARNVALPDDYCEPNGAASVDLEAKRQLFLAKAREAEDAAAKSSDAEAKETWLKIAVQYRELADSD